MRIHSFSRKLWASLSKTTSLSIASSGLAAVFLTAALDGTAARAQQARAESDGSRLPPVAADAIPASASYADSQPVDPDTRLRQLEQMVESQQAQIQSLQQLQSGGSAVGGAQVPGSADNLYPQGAAAPGPQPNASTGRYKIGSLRSMSGSWTNDGLVFSSPNGDFTSHIRWVSQLDLVDQKAPASNIGVPGTNSAGNLDSVDFRRLRIGVDGKIFDNIEYVMEFEFASNMMTADASNPSLQLTSLRSNGTTNQFGGTPGVQSGNVINLVTPTTNFLIFRDLPVLSNLRVGQQQDWFSLEHIESARWLDFMERSPIFDAFAGPNNAGYTPGISAFRPFFDERMHVQVGMYKTQMYDKETPYDIGNNNYTYGGRVVVNPYYDEPSNGRYMVHLAVAGEQRRFNTELNPNMNGDNIRLRTRGEIRNGPNQLTPNYTDTGNFYATGQGVLNAEMAVQWGPVLVQGEWCFCWMENAATQQGRTALPNAYFNGGYLEALYFLTGENRPYIRENGVFGRTIPNQSGYLVRGGGFSKGAWQVGARYDFMDLNSPGINGGQVQDMTLGLNWFWNPNARLQLNYVLAHVNNTAAVGVAVPAGSGVLAGTKFTGEGCISTVGLRQDFNF
jgi:phosphate-selective porin OprO/OprP